MNWLSLSTESTYLLEPMSWISFRVTSRVHRSPRDTTSTYKGVLTRIITVGAQEASHPLVFPILWPLTSPSCHESSLVPCSNRTRDRTLSSETRTPRVLSLTGTGMVVLSVSSKVPDPVSPCVEETPSLSSKFHPSFSTLLFCKNLERKKIFPTVHICIPFIAHFICCSW